MFVNYLIYFSNYLIKTTKQFLKLKKTVKNLVLKLSF